VDFSKARDLFVNIFQILGPNYKFLDCGLILEKPRGLSAKCSKLEFSGISFLKETCGPSPRVVNRAGCARSTADRRWRGPKAPERSPEYGRSGALKLTGGGAIERGEHGKLGSSLTGARVVAW
jgi:hypothetical protein